MIEKIEQDHHPEIVENGQGTHRLELLGINEHLRNPGDRRAFFSGMTNGDYRRMFGYINSLAQSEPISYEYSDGIMQTEPTPPIEDKEPLMNATFNTVRDILGDRELGDKTALRRAGLTMAGAINYIHPRHNGNGRTGRVSHYLIEFGTERGDQAFNEELYAVIAKTRVYDSDENVAIYDTTPVDLDDALNRYVAQTYPEDYASMPRRNRASARVLAFLDVMRGDAHITIPADALAPDEGSRRYRLRGVGDIDGVDLYERYYTRLSAIPNRLPSDVPEDAQRVMADNSSDVKSTSVPLDRM